MVGLLKKSAYWLAVSAAVAGPAVQAQEIHSAPQTLRAVLDHDYPRLVVVMSYDQFRGDYLTRFSDLFLPAHGANGSVGGFRYLMEQGAYMADAHYSYVPTFTGPGHATILTGAGPSGTGIVANDWLTSECGRMYCVEDETLKTVGGPNRPTRRGSSSPVNLLADTVGDVLQLSNNRLSKVVGIAIKDRASILLAGHRPTAAVWFDAGVGNWVTSTYYTTGTLPAFAARANDERLADSWLGNEWNYLLPRENYRRSAPENLEGIGKARGLPGTFPKRLSEPGAAANTEYYEKLTFTPFGNEMLFQLARWAVETEELGTDAHPDLLCLNFSTNDYVGHTYGPNSPEVQDLTLRTDRQLSDFLNYLRTAIPGGLANVTIVVTADHGAAPLPEYTSSTVSMPSARVDYSVYTNAALEAIRTVHDGEVTTDIVQFGEPYMYFRQSRAKEMGLDVAAARRAIAQKLAEMPGVYAAYTRDQIENGLLPTGPFAQYIYNGFHPERSGDVLLVSRPYWYPTRSSTGTTHGSAYVYDTHVPVLFAGPNIRPGMYTNRVDVRDIAPTLSLLLGITAPAASQGRILSEILQ